MMKKTNLIIILLMVCSTTFALAAPTLREVSKDLVTAAGDKSAVVGADGWLFLKDELLHMSGGQFWGKEAARVSRAKKKEFADPIPAIISYNEALADKGITLYLMPVPPKGLVYPEKLVEGVVPGDVENERAVYTDFYGQLRSNGVKVIDLLPQLTKSGAEENVYCKTDTHFSGSGLELFVKEAAKEIKSEPWYEAVSKKEYIVKEQQVSITGDLSQMLGLDNQEDVVLSVVTSIENGSQVQSEDESPVILMGDSHALVFSVGGDLHAKGAGLFDHLSARLGFPLDLLGVRGSGVTPARIKLYQRSKKNPAYLAGKKVLIWCFTAREFTGKGGWREIPVDAKK